MPTTGEANTTLYVPTTRDMIRAIFDIIQPMINESNDIFYDFGAGDGRVVVEASKYCKAIGIERRKDLVEKFGSIAYMAENNHNPFRVIQADFFANDVNIKDATIAFLNIVTVPESIKMVGRLTQSCPNLRILICSRQLLQFSKKLVATIEPPMLPGHMIAFFGEWEAIKNCTLDEMRRDNFRNIYAKMTDTAQTSDETFYVYKIK